jgi:endonuclease YncB( thermonuclease family)
MAWVYRKYAREPEYFAAEESARKTKIGLWAQKEPVPPWAFRKLKTNPPSATGTIDPGPALRR